MLAQAPVGGWPFVLRQIAGQQQGVWRPVVLMDMVEHPAQREIGVPAAVCFIRIGQQMCIGDL